MNVRRINWPLWTGLLLTIAAFMSFFVVFVWFPFTRDFPWANLLLFAIAGVLLFMGLRRGFASDRPHPTRSKIVTVIVSAFSFLVFALFVFSIFVVGRWLPASKGAPQVGQRVPDFTLPDTSNKPVSLNELLTTPINGKAPRGVLLVFYRGYW
jgi:predicted MFS family arabinose efflux permease